MKFLNKRLTAIILIAAASLTLLAGCSKVDVENQTQSQKETEDNQELVVSDDSDRQSDEQVTKAVDLEEISSESFPVHGDLYATMYDEGNTEQIKKWVDEIVKSSSSLQEEVEKVESLSDEYTDLLQEYNTQLDINKISYCSLQVWDEELNNLWGRMSERLDTQTKEELLGYLRTWNATKEDYIVASIGEREEGGSIYSLLYNSLMEDMTRKKVHILADQYAKFLGETYEKSTFDIEGYYANCEGTADIYDELRIMQSVDGGLNVEIGLYRITTLNGTAIQSGDVLYYTDSELDLTGIITCGWDGAIFTVVTSNFEYLKSGDTFNFDTVY
ncbi:MAG: DUF1311 domain-containing protein [Lachnospiraceae bacterium]|nr:DUF1311 domain-containing protein [Lachnospiraceae bacterium]